MKTGSRWKYGVFGVSFPFQRVVKSARDEVNRAFGDVLKEIKRLQTKVMDFIDQEERSALVKMGNSIQHRQEKLVDLRKQNLWLATLIDDPSEHQFLQVDYILSHSIGGRGEGKEGRREGKGRRKKTKLWCKELWKSMYFTLKRSPLLMYHVIWHHPSWYIQTKPYCPTSRCASLH